MSSRDEERYMKDLFLAREGAGGDYYVGLVWEWARELQHTTVEEEGAVGNVQALAQDYIELQATIKELEARCGVIKDQIADLMPYEAVEDPQVLDKGVVVQWIKGRRVEKFDPAKVKKGLVLNGIPIELIDEVYRSAASVTEGKPYLRITQEASDGK